MRLDHVTTSPEAAAQYERDHTPTYRETPEECVECPSDLEPEPWMREAALRADALLRGISWRRA